MNEFILKMVSPILSGIVADLLKPENLKLYGDKLFDFIEDSVKSSETTIDDATVLPIIQALRVGLQIPNNK